MPTCYGSTVFRAAIAALLAVCTAFGQRPNGPPDPQQRQAFLIDVMASQMNLGKEQRTQLQGILDKARESAKPIQEQILKTREAVRNTIREARPPATLDPLHKQLGHCYGQLVAIESKAFAEIWTMLTPEQKANSDVAYHMLGMLMAPPRPPGDRRPYPPPAPK